MGNTMVSTDSNDYLNPSLEGSIVITQVIAYLKKGKSYTF